MNLSEETMLYEVTLFGTVSGEAFVNRWNYVAEGLPPTGTGSIVLAEAFGALTAPPTVPTFTNVLFGLQSIAHASVYQTSLNVRAIYDVDDFVEVPFVVDRPGLQAGSDALPVFNAFGWRSNRVRQDIGRGYKRYPGVSEAFVGTGGFFNAQMSTWLDTVSSLMSEVLEGTVEAATVFFRPTVVQREKVELSPGRFTYRYYPTLTEQMQHVALGVTWDKYETVRSQMSRQYR